MWTSEFQQFRQLMSGQTGTNVVTSTASSQAQPAPTDRTHLPLREAMVTSAGLLILMGTWIIVRRSVYHWKSLNTAPAMGNEDDILPVGKASSQLPCTQCYYFKRNLYLPCAVNPTVALTEQSRDCSDFQPAEQKN